MHDLGMFRSYRIVGTSTELINEISRFSKRKVHVHRRVRRRKEKVGVLLSCRSPAAVKWSRRVHGSKEVEQLRSFSTVPGLGLGYNIHMYILLLSSWRGVRAVHHVHVRRYLHERLIDQESGNKH